MPYSRSAEAFTRRELMVVIVVLVVLGLMLLPVSHGGKWKAQRINCVDNLKQLGTAYRIWSNDNGEKFPAATPVTNGGWNDLLYQTNASTYCWTNYVTMANELGQSPMILACPADERIAGNAFTNLANTNISYFVGVNANDTYPQAILGATETWGREQRRMPNMASPRQTAEATTWLLRGRFAGR